ncbi:MAG: UDP-N-acetylglucosamine--N-acetylmuramyl-(pentapeptide) pyrophosphoryl-undecaprenol N-acetylglucosamine transferase, partial [Beijerinckiaceae bacterium]|nr:UDP-N-acetylglucosamine--N-acetylmuramyl-(pentapeptide) pyrophosphoryl-undecaprenol N-acetylglucosamine transferase [Beijerinckiaceae bacterium]MBX9757142.1 UDP-N-acetylglucosamine--N-acetylmuramyl-(pentapeptide) pyrophosphoryl-undecaprenol N-acetylglucosamine transferase [Beijerinckiaceae bacterium]
AHTILHEQNAVMGRANRFLAARVQRIATGFPRLDGVDAAILAKTQHTGNPVRPSVIAAAQTPYPSLSDGTLRILVTGGSQGARVMADVVPSAIAALPPDLRARVIMVQQARGEDEARVREAYAQLGVEADVQPFFGDLPQRIADAHLVISRAGASTVCELAVIGRPAILVPYPFALDQDQAANAAELAESGAVMVIRQSDFTPDRLAAEIEGAFADPEGLTRRAAAAKSAGVPDAAARLADLVMATAGLG